MHVTLLGTSPSAFTCGIMLLTRARQLGYALTVSVVGEPEDVSPVPGPAVVYAPVLASCGVGRENGSGATVVVAGPPGEPVMATVSPHGVEGWFTVDRTGTGAHPATQAFVRLSCDDRPAARELGRTLRRAMDSLGMSTDTAVLDVLFGAPVPPLLRLALALRAGRSMSGGRGQPITRYLAGPADLAKEPYPGLFAPADLRSHIGSGALNWVLNRLSTSIRDQAEAFCHEALRLAEEDDGRDLILLHALVVLASHLAQLPVQSILPPLGAAEDSVAVGLASALRAEGDGNANTELEQVYRFLGGRFTAAEAVRVDFVVSDNPPLEDGDHVARWQWFCAECRIGRKRADAIWEEVFHPFD
ncbi:MAG: hypothetical protein ACON4N_09030 [Myxococcota bacterium]